MPKEERLLGYAVGSRMTQQPEPGPDGQPAIDPDTGLPRMVPILELIFIEQMTGNAVILPLTEAGMEAVRQAVNPSQIVVPPPGMRL